MRLCYVNRFPVFSWTCARCGKHFTTADSHPIADLDGEAFTAYYCSFCSMCVDVDNEKLTGKETEFVVLPCMNTFF